MTEQAFAHAEDKFPNNTEEPFTSATFEFLDLSSKDFIVKVGA
jgi:hypothetical protein